MSTQHHLFPSCRSEGRGSPPKRTPHLQDTGWVLCPVSLQLLQLFGHHLAITTAGSVIHPSPLHTASSLGIFLPNHHSLHDWENKTGLAEAATPSNSDFKVICASFLPGLQDWEGKPEALFVLGAKQGIKWPSRVCALECRNVRGTIHFMVPWSWLKHDCTASQGLFSSETPQCLGFLEQLLLQVTAGCSWDGLRFNLIREFQTVQARGRKLIAPSMAQRE